MVGAHRFGAKRCNVCWDRKLRNGATFLHTRIEPSIVELNKNPLGPLHIFRIGGVDLAIPVVAKAERLNLLTEIVAILLRGNRWVRAGLNRILLGRQSKCIPAHGVQYVETLGALVSADDIGSGVTLGMPNMKPCATWIREHIEAVKLLLGHVIGGLESLVG